MSDEAPGVKPDDDEPHYTTQVFPPRAKTNGMGATSEQLRPRNRGRRWRPRPFTAWPARW